MTQQHSSVPELELLAGAIAGRALTLAPARNGTHTDGTTIFLGSDVPGGARVQQAVIAQAALVAAGSLDPAVMRRLASSPPGAARKYLGLEVVRASAALDGVLPRGFSEALTAYAARVGLTCSVEESLQRALGGARVAEAPEWFGELRPRALIKGRSPVGEPLSESELATAMRAAMDVEEPDDEADDGERSRLLEKLSSPLKSPLGSAFQKMLGARRSSSGGAAGTGTTFIQQRTGPHGQGAKQLAGQLPMSRASSVRDVVRGTTYPEWDHRTARYRDDWCTVGTFDPPADADAQPPVGAESPKLLRELSRLGLTWRPHDHEAFGDELDLTALVDHRVGVAAGVDSEPRVYRAERRTAQELGALVLLDATGSSTEQHGGKAVFEEQRDLAHGLTTALDSLGVRVATYAFYSRGRRNVRYLRCKSFEERWGVAAHRRLFSLSPTGFTRLGAAIRHGSHLLDTQAGTRQRLLIVIGDGAAYDDGYEGRYAVEDSRRAVEEAGARAVGCVGLSTRPSDDASAIWSDDAHRVTAGSADLAGEARVLFGTALRRVGHGTGTCRR